MVILPTPYCFGSRLPSPMNEVVVREGSMCNDSDDISSGRERVIFIFRRFAVNIPENGKFSPWLAKYFLNFHFSGNDRCLLVPCLVKYFSKPPRPKI